MAQRKGVIVTETVNTSEELQTFLAKSGLCVIDAYQGWCGPCKPVQNLFKRLKTEIGADKISFAMANCDKIKEMEIYTGSCEPLFLYYGGGQLCGMVRGCNAPLIERVAIAKAEEEVAVAEGRAKRTVIQQGSEPALPEEPPAEQTESVDNDQVIEPEQKLTDHNINKCITIAILNPDNAADGDVVSSILNDINLAGLTVIHNETRNLTEDNIKVLYSNEVPDDVVVKLTSGNCILLGLTKGETGASSIKLTDDIVSALEGPNYASGSIEAAERDLILLFPDFNIPKVTVSAQLRESMSRTSNTQNEVIETTLTIITPQAVEKYAEDIIKDIERLEFKIRLRIDYQFSDEEARKFFEFQEEMAQDDALIESLATGPCLVLLLEKDGAVLDWRSAIGPYQDAAKEAPDSLRAKYTVESGVVSILASSNSSQVTREAGFFFGGDAFL